MFGSKRKKVIQGICEALSPNIATVQKYWGLPVGFSEDSYVLGFLIGQVVAFKHLSGAKDWPIADQVQINLSVMEALSHYNRSYLTDCLERARTKESKVFDEARAGGELCVLGTFGLLINPDQDVDYSSAKRFLIATNQPSGHNDVMSELLEDCGSKK